MDDLTTNAENTWCPGCGNFGILGAFKQALKKLEEKGIDRKRIAITSGIGCHGKIADYMRVNGLYSIHGRSMATAQGIKLANPDLVVVAFAGDGDAYGEGIAHMVFAAKRNADITVVVHNNGAYALTTGQVSPTSQRGFKGPSTPEGSVEDPLNPLSLMLEAGATFVARGYVGRRDHLTALLVKAMEHKGFSLIDVLQPSVVFSNTYEQYNEMAQIVPAPAPSRDEAKQLAGTMEKIIPIGIFYQREHPSFHEALYGDRNPVRDRLAKAEKRNRVTAFTKDESSA